MANISENKLLATLLKHISEAIMVDDMVYIHALAAIPRQKKSADNSEKSVRYLTFGEKKERSSIPTHDINSDMYSERAVSDSFYRFTKLEDLTDYIKQNYPKKIDVSLLAKSLQVTAPKSSDYETTVERIVNATLGYRLRSQAVRGEPSSPETKKDIDS